MPGPFWAVEEASWRADCHDEDKCEDVEEGTRRGVQVGVCWHWRGENKSWEWSSSSSGGQVRTVTLSGLRDDIKLPGSIPPYWEAGVNWDLKYEPIIMALEH